MSLRPRRAARLAPFVPSVLLLAAACDSAPLRWEAPTLATAETDLPRSTARLPAAAMPTDARGVRCDSSLRIAGRAGADVVAAWWVVRGDSTAVLLAARGEVMRASRAPWEATTASWEPAVAIDTLDRGPHGCARPAPAIAFEPRTGYVHVSYALDAPEGTGVFFAHSMDAGRMYHSPVAIVYGPRLVRSAIAVRRDTVAVAYEDPNADDPPQVALALSVTAGHLFEQKSIVVTAGAYAASMPEVALDDAGVTVGWREQRPEREVPMRRRATWAR